MVAVKVKVRKKELRSHKILQMCKLTTYCFKNNKDHRRKMKISLLLHCYELCGECCFRQTRTLVNQKNFRSRNHGALRCGGVVRGEGKEKRKRVGTGGRRKGSDKEGQGMAKGRMVGTRGERKGEAREGKGEKENSILYKKRLQIEMLENIPDLTY